MMLPIDIIRSSDAAQTHEIMQNGTTAKPIAVLWLQSYQPEFLAKKLIAHHAIERNCAALTHTELKSQIGDAKRVNGHIVVDSQYLSMSLMAEAQQTCISRQYSDSHFIGRSFIKAKGRPLIYMTTLCLPWHKHVFSRYLNLFQAFKAGGSLVKQML